MREFVRKSEATWTQATTASIRDLTRTRLRINIFRRLFSSTLKDASSPWETITFRSEAMNYFATLERLMKK
jgi:hypothetical protein